MCGLGQVDHRQPAMSERDAGAGIDPLSLSVWSAVRERVAHQADETRQLGLAGGGGRVQYTGDPAHLQA